MENEGYILFYRSAFDNKFLMPDHKFTKFEIWMWLLSNVRWQSNPRSFTIRGIWITVKRGEIAESQDTLGDIWGWSRPNVSKLLKEFAKEGMIEIEESRVINKIRIVNYDKYQSNFSQQISQQNLQQKSVKQHTGLCQTDDVEENCENALQQNSQQILQQILQQISQPLNKDISSSSRIGDQQNFSSLIDVIEFVKAKKQPEALLQMSEMTLIPVDELSRVLDEFAVANIDAEKRTLLVWGKYFTACKDGILTRLRQQQNGTIAKNSIGHVGNDANRNGYKGRGAYEPDKDCKYEGHFGD